MRRNLINNYRFLDFPQETSIEIKQGDFTPITVKLDSTETIKDEGKDAKVILINTDNEKVFETSVPAKNKIIEFTINKNLPKGRYFLEIVYNQMKFPSKDYKTIIINGSASLGSLKEINIISADDVKNRFISEAKKELSADIDQLVSEKLNKYVTENQEDLKGQSISIASHEFDKNGNLNIIFSDETSIQIPKGKDGRDGENGRNGNDGQDGHSVNVDHVEYDEDGNTVIHFNDGKSAIIKKGVQGERGEDGLNGKDGISVSIKNIETDNSGNKIVNFTDGKSVTIPKGERGLDGEDGNDGKPFTYSDFTQEQLESLKGKDGNDGKQGADGKSITIEETTTNNQGDKEVHFSDGTILIVPKGQDGKQGEAGKNGENGTNGQDGKSVTVTSEREEDEEGNSGIKFTFYHEIDGEKAQEIASSFIRDGKDGKDGTSVEIDHTEEIDNDLKIYFTNGKSLFLPKTKVIETNTSGSTEVSQLKDLVGVFIGDSITEVNLRTEKNYHQFIADRTGLKNINLGHSGTGYQDRKNAFTEVKETPDFIIVFLGTNDYGLVGGKTRELGTAKEHKAGTVAGSIYYTLLQLSNSFPTTPIGVMTPIPRAECNPFKEVANSKGYTLGQLTEVIKELASSFSFPILDLYNESNLRVWNETVNKTFFSLSNGTYDGLHPNAKGHEYLSYMIERFIEDKLVVGTRFDYEHVDTTPTSLGDGVFKKAIKPEGMFWKTTQSFIINVTASDIDLDKFKLLKIKYKNYQIIDPSGILSGSPYWYTLPNYADKDKFNRTSDVNEFVKGFEVMDITESRGNEYMPDYAEFIYTLKTNTDVVADIDKDYILKSAAQPTTPSNPSTSTPTSPTTNTKEKVTPVDNGDGTFTATITPTKISWKQDQSFMVNIDGEQLDLTGKQVKKVEFGDYSILNPNTTASNYFFWYSVPTSAEGTTYNKTPDINKFVAGLTVDKTEHDGRIVYKLVPVKITYK
ncbi:SGNH/GDSL hydrolase family protein [Staphylococcus hominis]|uniref:SGNH/GDSL hydrolase family protein n=1 Tax=Staphylococcus hominis TaxID=1290 RepID=A0A974KYD0_STAHO|nr:GDSL-type esterase/lipase family protein [Staphylococcus hominis]PTK31821.1 SGNH/GDSL hydrolase family protein [Staphylococcus hominis]